jgi:hypothetical protein
MMHHMPGDLKRSGLRAIRRVLKPNERVVVVDAGRPAETLDLGPYRLMLHGALAGGIEDVAELLVDTGYTNLEMGKALSRHIGYARAMRA